MVKRVAGVGIQEWLGRIQVAGNGSAAELRGRGQDVDRQLSEVTQLPAFVFSRENCCVRTLWENLLSTNI